jgi:hypothetical protein
MIINLLAMRTQTMSQAATMNRATMAIATSATLAHQEKGELFSRQKAQSSKPV